MQTGRLLPDEDQYALNVAREISSPLFSSQQFFLCPNIHFCSTGKITSTKIKAKKIMSNFQERLCLLGIFSQQQKRRARTLDHPSLISVNTVSCQHWAHIPTEKSSTNVPSNIQFLAWTKTESHILHKSHTHLSTFYADKYKISIASMSLRMNVNSPLFYHTFGAKWYGLWFGCAVPRTYIRSLSHEPTPKL